MGVFMEKEELRVKFYSKHDMSIGHYFSRITNIIENFNSKTKITDINEIIELYNIQLFILNEIYSADWDEQKCKKYNDDVMLFSNTIGIFFSEINVDYIDQLFEILENDYSDDFWVLIQKYKVYEKFSPSIFTKLLSNKNFHLNQVLKCKKIVTHFSDEILSFMETNVNSVTILLDYFLVGK